MEDSEKPHVDLAAGMELDARSHIKYELRRPDRLGGET
jgi:hypothetical protein